MLLADCPRLHTQPECGHRDRYPMRTQDWATVLIPLIHRDPSVWGENAQKFRPNRFLPENSRGRAPHS